MLVGRLTKWYTNDLDDLNFRVYPIAYFHNDGSPESIGIGKAYGSVYSQYP